MVKVYCQMYVSKPKYTFPLKLVMHLNICVYTFVMMKFQFITMKIY